MIISLLDFLSEKGLYSEEDILKAKLKIIEKTNMVDLGVNLYQILMKTEEQPEDFTQKRQGVLERLIYLEKETSEIFEIFNDPEVIKQLRQDKQYNIQFLKENYNF